MDFNVYLDVHGWLRGRRILRYGPVVPCPDHVTSRLPACPRCRPLPGAILLQVPVSAGVDVRLGLVVATLSDRVYVAWNPWAADLRYREHGAVAQEFVRCHGDDIGAELKRW